MAVQYESDGGAVFCAANNNNSITVPLPATRPVGSVLLFVGFSRLISDVVGTAPSGYTLLSGFPLSSGTASGGRIWVYARVVDGSESAPSFACTSAVTGNSGDLWGACIFCYSGVDTGGGLNSMLDGTPTTTDAAGTTTCTYPALTITNTDSMIVRFLVRFRDAADTFTPTATWNEREDIGTTTRLGGQLHLQDKAATVSGSQASVTVAPSNTTSSRYLAVTMALKAVVGQAETATPADTVTLSDAQSEARGLGRADTIVLSDAQSEARGLGRADPVVLSDARVMDRGLARADALVLSDLISPVLTGDAFTATPSDSLALSDQLSRALVYARSRPDTLSLSDSIDTYVSVPSVFTREIRLKL